MINTFERLPVSVHSRNSSSGKLHFLAKLLLTALICLQIYSPRTSWGGSDNLPKEALRAQIMDPIFPWDYTQNNPHAVEFNFNDGALQQMTLQGLSLKRLVGSWSAQIDNKITRTGAGAVRFELRPGDRVSGGWRAELRDLNNAQAASDVWYAHSIFIPHDFPSEPKNSYVLIQWHDQKVPWNNPAGHSPPLALRYRNGQLDLTLRHGFKGQKDGENGRELVLFSAHNVKRGRWHDLAYHITWPAINPSDYEDGRVQMWLNGEMTVDYIGPIGYQDDVGAYVKFGIYSRHDVQQPHVIFQDEYRRGKDAVFVCPSCISDTTPNGNVPTY